ncbi:hypothetical protein H0H93_016298, partial [Arthromyces matolae]
MKKPTLPELPPNVRWTNCYSIINGYRFAGMLLSPAAARELATKLSGHEIQDPNYGPGMGDVLNIVGRATRPHSIGLTTIGEYGEDIAYVIVTHSEYLPEWHTMDLTVLPPFEEKKGPGRDRIARKLLEDA